MRHVKACDGGINHLIGRLGNDPFDLFLVGRGKNAHGRCCGVRLAGEGGMCVSARGVRTAYQKQSLLHLTLFHWELRPAGVKRHDIQMVAINCYGGVLHAFGVEVIGRDFYPV